MSSPPEDTAVTPFKWPNTTWEVVEDYSTEDDDLFSVVLDTSGLYLLGFDRSATPLPARFEKRRLEDGSLIWSIGTNMAVNRLLSDSTGLYATDSFDWVEKRSLGNGSLLWGEHLVPLDASEGQHRITDMAISGDILLLARNQSGVGVTTPCRLERRDASDGSLKWTQLNVCAGAVVIDGAELYLTTGTDHEKRSTSDGELIWSKDGTDHKPAAMAADSTGVYIAGAIGGTFLVEKIGKADGEVIWQKTWRYDDYHDAWAQDIAVDETGVYTVGGFRGISASNVYDLAWRLEKRDLSDGALSWEKTSNPTGLGDHAKGVALGGFGVYAAGVQGTAFRGNGAWRIEKRAKQTGDL